MHFSFRDFVQDQDTGADCPRPQYSGEVLTYAGRSDSSGQLALRILLAVIEVGLERGVLGPEKNCDPNDIENVREKEKHKPWLSRKLHATKVLISGEASGGLRDNTGYENRPIGAARQFQLP